MESTCFYRTIYKYQTIRRHIPEEIDLSDGLENPMLGSSLILMILWNFDTLDGQNSIFRNDILQHTERPRSSPDLP